MSDKMKKIVGYITLAFLCYLFFKNVNIKEIAMEIKKIPPQLIAVLMFLQLVTQLLLGFQWFLISKNFSENCSYYKIMKVLTTGTVVEAITPGAKIGGEITRLYYLKKELSYTTQQAAHIILMQKSISMSVLFTICTTSFIFICNKISNYLPVISEFILTLLSILFIIVLVGFLFFSKKLAAMLENSKNKFLRKISSTLKSYGETTAQLSKLQWIIQFTISFLVWILFPFKMVFLAKYAQIQLPFVMIITVTMTSYMAGMLPITPGGLGTFEGTMISILTLLTIPAELSATVTIVFRFITFWFVILASGLFILFTKRRSFFENRNNQ